MVNNFNFFIHNPLKFCMSSDYGFLYEAIHACGDVGGLFFPLAVTLLLKYELSCKSKCIEK